MRALVPHHPYGEALNWKLRLESLEPVGAVEHQSFGHKNSEGVRLATVRRSAQDTTPSKSGLSTNPQKIATS